MKCLDHSKWLDYSRIDYYDECNEGWLKIKIYFKEKCYGSIENSKKRC